MVENIGPEEEIPLEPPDRIIARIVQPAYYDCPDDDFHPISDIDDGFQELVDLHTQAGGAVN